MPRILDYHDDLFDKYLSPFLKQANLPEKNKENLKDSDFALIVRHPNGDIRRYFPVHDEINIQLSADYFTKTASKLSPRERIVAAYHIKKAAEAFGVDVPGYINAVLEGVEAEIPSNIVDLAEEPEEEAEEKEYLLPDDKMIPVDLSNLDDYVKNFEKIASNLEEDKREEAAFNLFRLVHTYKGPKYKLPVGIAKLAQAYSRKQLALERKKKEIENALALQKLARNIINEWHTLDPKTKAKVARIFKHASEAYSSFHIPESVMKVMSDYAEHGINSQVMLNNFNARAELIDKEIWPIDPVAAEYAKSTLKSLAHDIINMKKTGSMDYESLIENLRRFDESYGLNRFWGYNIDDPWVTFSKYGYSSVFSAGANPVMGDTYTRSIQKQAYLQKVGAVEHVEPEVIPPISSTPHVRQQIVIGGSFDVPVLFLRFLRSIFNG